MNALFLLFQSTLSVKCSDIGRTPICTSASDTAIFQFIQCGDSKGNLLVRTKSSTPRPSSCQRALPIVRPAQGCLGETAEHAGQPQLARPERRRRRSHPVAPIAKCEVSYSQCAADKKRVSTVRSRSGGPEDWALMERKRKRRAGAFIEQLVPLTTLSDGSCPRSTASSGESQVL